MSVNLSKPVQPPNDLIPKVLNSTGWTPTGAAGDHRAGRDGRREFSLGKLRMLKSLGVSTRDRRLYALPVLPQKRMPLETVVHSPGLREGDSGDRAIISGTISLARPSAGWSPGVGPKNN